MVYWSKPVPLRYREEEKVQWGYTTWPWWQSHTDNSGDYFSLNIFILSRDAWHVAPFSWNRISPKSKSSNFCCHVSVAISMGLILKSKLLCQKSKTNLIFSIVNLFIVENLFRCLESNTPRESKKLINIILERTYRCWLILWTMFSG